MLKPGARPIQMQKWYDRLAPLAARARNQLREMDPSLLLQRSGCNQGSDGAPQLAFLWRDYSVRPPSFAIQERTTGKAPSEFIQALILTYLVTADGSTPSGRWIAYRDLPDGMFYAQAFRGYAENRLVRELGKGGLAAFRRAAERLGGESFEIGSGGYAFQVLPRISLAAVYWQGDEDFPSQASILFEDTAPHYMSTDGLAVLGSHLVSALLRMARE